MGQTPPVNPTPGSTNGATPGSGGPASTAASDNAPTTAETSAAGGGPTGAGASPGTAASPGTGGPSEAAASDNNPTSSQADATTGGGQTNFLARLLGIEDSPVKVYGWSQNSYTGNTNGQPRNGSNFSVFLTGSADNYYEMTLGLPYKPKPWLWIRPEARYDWAQYKTPFSDGTRGSQLTLAFDIIVQF